MSIEITRASNKDVELISQLGAQTFDQAFRGTCTDEDLEGVLQEYYNEEQVTKELNDADDYFFVLYQNKVATGYSRIHLGRNAEKHFTDKKSAELMRIYFLEEFHGKGLAVQLLNYCFDFLREKEYEQVYLSVWEHNHRAKSFYEKHGFKDTNIQNPFPLGETPQMDYWFLKQL
jgi:ribosomal protein S18 acetylase RimI-like enzyme